MSERLNEFAGCVAIRSATFDVDDCLIRFMGNLALRDIALSPVEKLLIEAAIGRLEEIRGALGRLESRKE